MPGLTPQLGHVTAGDSNGGGSASNLFPPTSNFLASGLDPPQGCPALLHTIANGLCTDAVTHVRLSHLVRLDWPIAARTDDLNEALVGDEHVDPGSGQGVVQ